MKERSRSITHAAELEETDAGFARVLDRALDGEYLEREEVVKLLTATGNQFHMLTLAADALRRRLVGDRVTYVVNRNLNFTNICRTKCAFCGFARDAGDQDAYMLDMDQVREKVREAKRFGVTEICAQGGINQKIDLDYLLDLLETIRDEMPRVHIHAFSPMEIHHVAHESDLSVEEVLRTLRGSGLNTMPGTAAEILVDGVRKSICPQKINSRRWEEIIRIAHENGIRTTSTMMYGTLESPGDRAKHLIRIRGIQEDTGGFTEFVPLPFVHGKSPLSKVIDGGPSGVQDLRVIAASRLTLSSEIPNIQVSWVKMGLKLAQVGLTSGANDFGGTLMEENISRNAGETPGSLLEPQRIESLVRELGRTPVERSTIYELLA